MTVLSALLSTASRLGWCLSLLVLIGCEPLYQSFHFTEPLSVALPVEVSGDEVWVTSLPSGADVYVQPFVPDQVPSHAIDPDAYKGKTPLRFTLPPGSHWIEVALDAEVFENYFSPPFDNAQFEADGAASEALFFKPFAPGEKRRVLRYYHVEKRAYEGQTLIALFHPRGEPLERVLALYPQQDQYQFVPQDLRPLFQRAQVPETVQETLLTLLKRGGKAFWNFQETYRVGLELRPQAIQGRIVMLYKGTPRPDPLIPDGGGF